MLLPLTTLLARSHLHVINLFHFFRNGGPLFYPVTGHEIPDGIILLKMKRLRNS